MSRRSATIALVFWLCSLSACTKPYTVPVSQLTAQAPRPMVARKIEVPLFVSVEEFPDRISTDGSGGRDRIFHLTELRSFVHRSLRPALESLFSSVTVIDRQDQLPAGPHYLLLLRLDAIGTELTGESRTEQSITGSGSNSYMVGTMWFDWAAGLRTHDADEFMWNLSDRTHSTGFSKKAEAPMAVTSALSAIMKAIIEGVDGALQEAPGEESISAEGGEVIPPAESVQETGESTQDTESAETPE